MAQLAGHKYIGPVFQKEMDIVRVVYDFAKDGGAAGALDIFEAKEDIVITHFHSKVVTAATSGGSATLKVGVTGSDARFMNTTQGAVANLTAGAVVIAPAVEGTPNVLALPVKLAAGDKILQTIAVAALTAGKIEFTVGYVKA